MKKKLFSLFIAIVMLMSLMVLPASAEVYQGKYGSISWTFDDETGILTISGNGTLKGCPWRKHTNYVTEAVIEEGITELGLEVLSKHYSLETVHLPSSLETIQASVFLHSPVERIIYSGTEDDWINNIYIDYWTEYNPVFDNMEAFTFLGDEDEPEIGGGDDSGDEEDILIEYYYDLPTYTTDQFVSISLPTQVTAVTDTGDELILTFSYPAVDFSVPGEHRIRGYGNIPEGYYMEGYEDGTFEVQFSVFVNAAPQGVCGANLNWIIKNGVLEISGSGDMYNYDNDIAGSEIPWKNYAETITKLSLTSAMSSISKDFIAGTNVSSVTLPSSVTKIADGAFRNATKLTYVSSNSYFVKETSTPALYSKDMKKLIVYYNKKGSFTSYYIPVGVEEVAPYAFQYVMPETVFVPASVTKIGTESFSADSKLVGHKGSISQQYATENGNTFIPTYVSYIQKPADVTVTVGNTPELPTETVGTLTTKETVPVYISYQDDIPTDKPGTVYVYPKFSVSGDWEIPDSPYFKVIVETPRYEGTSNTVSWLLQDGVLTLSGSGNMADEIPWADYMDEIKSVSIGSNITYIPQGAFAGANVEGISSHSPSYPVVNGVLFNENTLFCYPAKLPGASYVVADDITAIAKKAFAYATNLETVTVKKTVNEIGEDAFIGTNLKLIVDGGSVAHSFAQENNLTFELLPAEIIETGSYNGFTYTVDENYHMTVSGNGYVPKNYRLRPDCYDMIKSITFEEGISGLDSYITYFENVEEINFPASATSLYSFVDIDCPNLKRVTVAEGNERYYAVDGVMFQHTNNALLYYPSARTNKVYTVPAECQWIREAFAGSCPYLEEIRIGVNVTTISSNMGNCTSLKSIVVDADNDYFTSIDGVLYNDNCTHLIQFPVAHPAQSFTVPSTVNTIETSAFAGAINLETVLMSDSVTKIEYEAFREALNLKNVTLSDSLEQIESDTFYGCTALEQINLPSSLQTVYYGAFYGCKNLTSALNFPAGMTLIDEIAFYDCSSITSVSIPSGVEIGRHAFDGCSSMETLTLAEGVTTVDYGAFSGCTSLKSLVIPSTMTELDSHLFAGCTGLETLVVSEGVRFLGNSDFSECSSLVSVTLPDSLEELASSVFSNCSSLETITIPENIKELPYETFQDCSSLKTINLPDNLEIIGPSAFDSCVALENITIPENVHTIGNYAFYNCKKLVSVTLPDSVQTIDESAFYKCTSLESVNIPYGVTAILYGTFRNCTSLKEIVLPETVTTIDSYAFYGCTALEKIVIPESVTQIASNSFSGCSNLTIYGQVGSYAHTYAESKNIPFIGLEKTIISVGDTWNNLTGADLLVGDEYTFPDGVKCIIDGKEEPVTFDIIYDGLLDTSYAQTKTIIATLVVPDGYVLPNGIVTQKVLTFNVSYPYASGKLDNISWTVADGVLTISGSGNIPDFIYDNSDYTDMPWFRYREYIYSIVIEQGITGVGANAFRYLRWADSVSIPEGVTYLGANAFEGVSSETKGMKFTLPSTLTDLGDSALEHMYIREITLPEGITYLPDNLFYKSPYLTTVTIEGKLTNIGEYVFYGCPIQTVYFAGTTAEWNNISIAEKGNEDLFEADIYCNDPIFVPLDQPVADYKIDYNTNTASIVVDVPKSAIAAASDGVGEIIAIGVGANGASVQNVTPIKDAGSHDLSVSTEGVTEVKIFIWDSLETMRPLALPVIIKVPTMPSADGGGK